MNGIPKQDVVLPKVRPRHKNEEEADFEAEQNEGDGEKAVH